MRITIPAILVAVTSVLFLYRSPRAVSGLDIVPDSVEYAVGAEHIVADDSCHIVIDGTPRPCRYPPWFSMFFLAPAYSALGPEIGNAVFPVLGLATAGVAIAFLLGRAAGGIWSGIFAAVAVMALPSYREYSGLIMTDAPCAALVLAGCLIYTRMRAAERAGPSAYLVAGLIAALSAAIRPVSAAILLPFVAAAVAERPKRRAAAMTALLLLPALSLVALTLAHNRLFFGSPWRSGYSYWCAVPYDYPSLVFSPAYLFRNARTAVFCGLVPVIACAALALHAAARKRTDNSPDTRRMAALRAIAEYAAIVSGPMILFHLFYFFAEPRFFLPPLSLFAVLTAAAVGIHASARGRLAVPVLCMMTLSAAAYRIAVPEQPAARRGIAGRLAERTPENAMIISAVNPAYLEYMVARGTRRVIMPVSRRIEYADKLISRSRTPDPDPAPSGPFDHRCPGLKDVTEAVRFVAAENLDLLSVLVCNGYPIYVETTGFAEDEIAAIFSFDGWRLESAGPNLYRAGKK